MKPDRSRCCCDSGERYRSTIFDDAWLAQRGTDVGPAEAAMERFFETGVLAEQGSGVLT